MTLIDVHTIGVRALGIILNMVRILVEDESN